MRYGVKHFKPSSGLELGLIKAFRSYQIKHAELSFELQVGSELRLDPLSETIASGRVSGLGWDYGQGLG